MAPIHALTILQNGGACDFVLQRLDLLDGDQLQLRIFAGECFLRLGAGGVQRIGTSRFAGKLVRSGDIRADKILELRLDRGMVIARSAFPRLLGGLLGKLDDRVYNLDRKSVVKGKSVSDRLDIVGSCTIKKKKK